MKIQISKRFVKDAEKITDPRILAKIRMIVESTNTIQGISEITGTKEMAGHPNFYRIKFDFHYRIGVHCDGETVQFLRVGVSGDFYKKFP